MLRTLLIATILAAAPYQDWREGTTPSNPPSGTRRLFVDSSTHEISVRTSAGITVSLEAQGAGLGDGDKGDITVSSSGTVWSVDASAVNFSELAGTVGDTQIAAGAVDGGNGGEIADGSVTADDLGADSVSASELDELGVESSLEAVLDLADLQGTLADSKLASNYSGVGACGANTWASTLNDNAAPTCTQPSFSNLGGTATDAQVPDNITVSLAATATALAANGGNCSGNNFALGVDASGIGECAQPTFANLSAAGAVEVSINMSNGSGVYSTSVAASWVTSSSTIVCSPFATTADSGTPEMAVLGGFTAAAYNRNAGVGFTLYVFNNNGAAGTFRFHCIGV